MTPEQTQTTSLAVTQKRIIETVESLRLTAYGYDHRYEIAFHGEVFETLTEALNNLTLT